MINKFGINFQKPIVILELFQFRDHNKNKCQDPTIGILIELTL